MMKIFSFRSYWTRAVLFALVFAINGCEGPFWGSSSSSSSNETQQSIPQTLTVAFKPGNFAALSKSEGLEKDLIQSFAKFQGIRIQWLATHSDEESIRLLQTGSADLAIGRLTSELAQKNKLLEAATYAEISYELICPEEMELQDKAFPVFIPWKYNDSQISEELQNRFPLANLVVVNKLGTKEILHKVSERRQACTLLDKDEAKIWTRLTPTLNSDDDFDRRSSVSILISPQAESLQSLIQNWFQHSSRNREIIQIKDRYLGHLKALTSNDRDFFYKKIAQNLNALKSIFQSSAADFELPWQLVAAVAFQESHWNNSARSFTGVKGIMQITEETASHLGLENRNELEQSVWGGAKYLRSLLNRQPRHLHARDRLALALATYNVGIGHMRDARKLAVQMNKNPHSWNDLKTVLPLLSDASYYSTLEFGKARGDEPVEFTNRVLSYFDLLTMKL